MLIRMVGASDVGRRRKNNQDSLYFDEPQGFAVVADGIGGRKGGEVASSMVVNGLKTVFLQSDKIRHDEIHAFLASAIDRINQDIIQRGMTEDMLVGMGTTVNCLMFVGDKLHLAHVGDTRTYMYFEKHLWQLTLDHNVKTFVEKGWLPQLSLQQGGKPLALTRAMGLVERCDVDIYKMNLKKGQLFLTCSDGLTSMVDDVTIAATLSKNFPEKFKELPKILIDKANKNGGKDNITVLLSYVEED